MSNLVSSSCAPRTDFPLLVNNPLEVFLDSTASAQKPSAVLDAMRRFSENDYANVHRGIYPISQRATDGLEAARGKVGRFVGANGADEIVFTKNTTESLNLVANGLAGTLQPGDVILSSQLEHHSNFLPWLVIAQRTGAEVRLIPVNDEGVVDLTGLDQLMRRVKVVAVTGMSNVTGEILPLAKIAEVAHAAGSLVVVDGAQLVPHHPVDVRKLDVDFLAFSGHKLGGPTGIGVLWGRRTLLKQMPPFLVGGGMINDVTETGFTAAEAPEKFEAGTPPIVEAVGLGAAIDYITAIGMEEVRAHERSLVNYTLDTLLHRFGDRIRIHGPSDAEVRGGVFSFEFEDLHAHDVGQGLAEHHVSVRTGHHCAKPLMRRLKVAATTRASVWIYNDQSDIDALADALEATSAFWARIAG